MALLECWDILYVSAACALRIAEDIVSLLLANRDATHSNMAMAILASIGLSPLLALGDFLHEVHLHLLEETLTAGHMKKARRWLMMAQLQIHGISVLEIALAIIGNIKLLSSNSPLSVTEISTDVKRRSSGSALLLVLRLSISSLPCTLDHIVWGNESTITENIFDSRGVLPSTTNRKRSC